MKRIISVFLCIFLAFAIISCGETNVYNTNDKKADEIDELIPEKLNQSIILPETLGDYEISWTSSNEEVLDNQGKYFVPTEVTTLTLKASITKDGQTEEKTYTLTTDLSIDDSFNIAYNSYRGVIKAVYTRKTTFTYSKYREYTASFVSLNPEAIDDTGAITQKDYDQDVIIELTITNDNTKESRVYYIMSKVCKYSSNTYLDMISEWVGEKVEQVVSGKLDKLPTEHELYPSTIVWVGGLELFVSTDGKIVRPVEKVTDSITCNITYNEVTISKSYEVKDFGGATEEEFLDQWLEFIMPTEIITHKNYTKWITNDYYFDHQIPIYTGGVLNLIDGKPISINMEYYNDVVNDPTSWRNQVWYNLHHRGVGTSSNQVDQKDLDAIFGEGYVIPNDDNIFWIVVHESGMARPGENAELLAKTQRNNLTSTNGYRQASWHYQVDHNVIYQSFPESIEAWHAGGNYAAGPHYPYGNTNSVGIEMCINADGNYDGALHNDTKLVANLVNKYNLTLKNVQRHFDFAGKECPAYMIRTNRWTEFLKYVNVELYAIKYLRDASVTWEVSNLDTLFNEGVNGLYYAKAVDEKTDVTITLKVVKGSYSFERTVILSLYPDNIDLSVWYVGEGKPNA